MAASMTDVDVVVVGMGPVGATAANLLAAQGVSVLVLERAYETYALPRAVHFDDETMRVFQSTGCAPTIAPTLAINPGMQFVSSEGAMLLDWPRPQVVTPNGWFASYRFHQPDVERALVAGLARYDCATVERGALVQGVSNGAGSDRATVRYATKTPDGVVSHHDVRAKYVLGCDGANSNTRRVIGIESAVEKGVPRLVAEDAAAADDNMEDLGFEERWLVVDVVLKRPMPELGSHTRQTCDPVRPSTYTRQPGERRRWEMKILEGETDAEVSDPAWVQAFLMRPQAGRPAVTPEDATVERIVSFPFPCPPPCSSRRLRLHYRLCTRFSRKSRKPGARGGY